MKATVGSCADLRAPIDANAYSALVGDVAPSPQPLLFGAIVSPVYGRWCLDPVGSHADGWKASLAFAPCSDAAEHQDERDEEFLVADQRFYFADAAWRDLGSRAQLGGFYVQPFIASEPTLGSAINEEISHTHFGWTKDAAHWSAAEVANVCSFTAACLAFEKTHHAREMTSSAAFFIRSNSVRNSSLASPYRLARPSGQSVTYVRHCDYLTLAPLKSDVASFYAHSDVSLAAAVDGDYATWVALAPAPTPFYLHLSLGDTEHQVLVDHVIVVPGPGAAGALNGVEVKVGSSDNVMSASRCGEIAGSYRIATVVCANGPIAGSYVHLYSMSGTTLAIAEVLVATPTSPCAAQLNTWFDLDQSILPSSTQDTWPSCCAYCRSFPTARAFAWHPRSGICGQYYTVTGRAMSGEGKVLTRGVASIMECVALCDARQGCTGLMYNFDSGHADFQDCYTYKGGESNVQVTPVGSGWESCLKTKDVPNCFCADATATPPIASASAENRTGAVSGFFAAAAVPDHAAYVTAPYHDSGWAISPQSTRMRSWAARPYFDAKYALASVPIVLAGRGLVPAEARLTLTKNHIDLPPCGRLTSGSHRPPHPADSVGFHPDWSVSSSGVTLDGLLSSTGIFAGEDGTTSRIWSGIVVEEPGEYVLCACAGFTSNSAYGTPCAHVEDWAALGF
jgi:hypothetical protein